VKIREIEYEILGSGVVQEREFGIKSGAVLMEMLSRLYKNPIQAVVREYWTNAEDGHVALRKQGQVPPRPVEIHVPNEAEPWFAVRDYGVGMSYDTAWNTYPVYVESTKTDSNDETGGLGLGCKSAYAYREGGDQWTVTSYFEGRKYLFVAARNSRGVPTFSLFEESDTLEPNGVEVRVPVARRHLTNFQIAVAKFSRHAREDFDIVGHHAGLVAGDYARETYAYKNSAYGYAPKFTQTPAVVMGSVAYPLDIYAAELTAEGQFCKGKVFFLPIGSLDISPSREELEYTDHTKAALLLHLRSSHKEGVKMLENFDPRTNFWGHVEALSQIFWRRDWGSWIIPHVVNDATPEYGQIFADFWSSKMGTYHAAVALADLQADPAVADTELSAWKMTEYLYSNGRVQTIDTPELRNFNVLKSDNMDGNLFLAASLKEVNALKRLIRAGSPMTDVRRGDHFWVLSPSAPEANLSSLLGIIGLLPYKSVSEILTTAGVDLNARVKSISPGQPKELAEVYVWTSSGWQPKSVDLEAESGYYVEFAYRKWQPGKFHEAVEVEFGDLLSYLSNFGDYDSSQRIYGIPRTRLKELDSNSWVSLEEEFAADLKDILLERSFTEPSSLQDAPIPLWDIQQFLAKKGLTDQFPVLADLKLKLLAAEKVKGVRHSERMRLLNKIQKIRNYRGLEFSLTYAFVPEVQKFLDTFQEVEIRYPWIRKGAVKWARYAADSDQEMVLIRQILEDREELLSLRELVNSQKVGISNNTEDN